MDRDDSDSGSGKSDINRSMEDEMDMTEEITAPGLQSPNLQDWKTPPLQTAGAFADVLGTNHDTAYSEIQNLPTPIVATVHRNRLSSANNGGSPQSPPNRVFSFRESNSENALSAALRIPKTRLQCPTKRKTVLADSNWSSNGGEDAGTDKDEAPKRFISEFKDRDISVPRELQEQSVPHSKKWPQTKLKVDISNLNSLPNIKPVERIVSMPVYQHAHSSPAKHPHDDHQHQQIQPSLASHTETSDAGGQKDEVAIPPVHMTTYSVDGNLHVQRWTASCEIGSGSFSKVYLADDARTALKVTDVSFNRDSNQSHELYLRIQNSLTRELEILKILKHPNIIKLIGTDFQANSDTSSSKPHINRITMAIEYCEGGDLYSFILKHRQQVNYELIRCIFSNLVSGVFYMHNKDVCHRDIKLENILLKYPPQMIISKGIELSKNHMPIVVLSDFGLSKKIDLNNPMLTTRCGSEDYVSPELLLGMAYDGKQNDCWSTGVVLYTMLESRLPFDPLPNERVKPGRRVSKPAHRIAMISWSWYLLKDAELSVEFSQPKEIVKMLLTKRNKRANMEDVKNLPYCLPYIL